MRIRVGHSPDPDDAFMYWAIAAGRVDTRGLAFEQVPADIQTLNEWASSGRLEVTAMSLSAYPHAQDRYLLLPHGGSFGSGYGPIVVAAEPIELDELADVEIAVPGRRTTAFLALRLLLGRDFPHREMPFDTIPAEVASGHARAGLLIHEGQLTYAQLGLRRVLDLGEWWHGATGLPLPLGVNAVRRDLGPAVIGTVSAVLRDAISAGLATRDEALPYALEFGRGLDADLGSRFVDMYVNGLTLDQGAEGRAAIEELLRRGEAVGAFPARVRVEFAPLG